MFDIACGWPMYRVPYAGSYRYKCGYYQQSHGQECSHNHVDGPQADRFLFSCIRQQMGGRAFRELEKRLRKFADQHAANAAGADCSHGKSTDQAELVQIQEELKTAGRNLALAKSAEHFQAVSAVFDDLKVKEAELTKQLSQQPERPHTRFDPDVEVEAALAVLRRLEDLGGSDGERHAKPILDLVNARLFLSFKPTQVKKRVLNKLQLAVVTMGDAPPPVELYAGPTGRRALKQQAAMVAAMAGEPDSAAPPAGGEAVSSGNVSRADRI